MIKTYKANTNVSINVVLPSKKNLHISFVPLSNGSSTFTTDNEEIMNAIECHYNFGKLFRLESVNDESIVCTSEDKRNNTKAKESCLKKIYVADIASAKDFLADNCNISRTILRTEKSILEQANACGIEFYGMSGKE